MRKRVEDALGWWGRFVAANAGKVILVVFIATGLLLTQLQHFRLDTSTEGFFHGDDPVRLQYDAFREIFGRDAMILVALKPAGGVFETAFLEELRTMHQELEEEVPLLVEVTSLLNVRETIGSDEGLEVGDFLEDWPESVAELRSAEARARANPLYRNFLLSERGDITTIVIETEAYTVTEDLDSLAGFDEYAIQADGVPGETDSIRIPVTGADDLEIWRAVEKIIDRHRSDALLIHGAGQPAFSSVLTEKMGRDMATFSGLSLVLVVFFLTMLFRRTAAVLLPILTVGLSVVSTLAVMGATDTPMMPPTQIIPSFLLAVGIGGAVHLLAIFYQALRRGSDKPEAISYALAHSGLPIVMTSLTTAGGLLSFIPAALRPISHFGAITPIGVLLSLFFVLTLLPALIAVFPMRSIPVANEDTVSQRGLVSAGRFSSRHASLVLGIWGALIAVSIAGIFRIHLGHDMLEWMPTHEPMYQATHFLNDEFGGAGNFELLIETGEENGLHDPDLLKRIDEVARFTEEFEYGGIHAGKVVSIVDVVKETHRALNENREAYYAVPDERALISQELLLFENSGSDDVEDLVTAQFDTARLTARLPFEDGALYNPYFNQYMTEIRSILGPEVELSLTGSTILLGNTISAALETMLRSYATALLVITILMVALIGRLRLGLVSMIPNLAPVLFALGLMGWFSIPLDMFTLLIGTIIIGLAVDDTIHFMHNFRREVEKDGDVEKAIASTLRGTGQALLFTSLVLATSFLVYTQAYMVHVFNFGILAASAIAMAFLADLTLAPALVTIAMPRRPRQPQ